MRIAITTLILLLAVTGSASAQSPFAYKPIDTDKLILAPTNTVAAGTANASTSTIRTLGRTIASAIEDNGFVRTFNNVFGRRATPPNTQPGFSPLPVPEAFASTRYKNQFKPTVPMFSRFGVTPNVPVPQGPTSIR